MSKNYEIERKYIIKMPVMGFLKGDAHRVLNITQAYIGMNTDGFNCRIRRIIENCEESYIFTEKKNINGIKRIENECYIDESTFNHLFKNRLKNRNVIEKTRYVIEKNGFNYEIDVFPFWKNQAFMEIELENENVMPPELEGIEIISDVTFDAEYSNFAISLRIPEEIATP